MIFIIPFLPSIKYVNKFLLFYYFDHFFNSPYEFKNTHMCNHIGTINKNTIQIQILKLKKSGLVSKEQIIIMTYTMIVKPQINVDIGLTLHSLGNLTGPTNISF